MTERPTELSVSVHIADGRAVLRLDGEIDITNAAVIDEHVAQALDDGVSPRTIVFDVGGVRFIDSHGLNRLVHHRRTVDDCIAMAIENPSGHVRRLIEVTGLDRIFVVDGEVA